MRRDESEVIRADPGAQHRRGGVRHQVALQALMIHPTGATVPCEIVDVSNGGMALEVREARLGPEHASFRPGTNSVVRFAPSAGEPDETVSVPCAVMWVARQALGVRFEQTDAKLRAALKQAVHAAIAERREDERAADHEPSAEQRRLLKLCRRTLQTHVPNMVWTLRTNAMQRLRAQPGTDARSAQATKAAAELLEAKAMSIGLTAEHRFLSAFSDAFQLQRTQELTVTQIRAAMREAEARAAAAASREEPDEDDRLLLRVVQEANERYALRFRALDARLAKACDHETDGDSNPLEPGPMCRILWESVTEHACSVVIRQALELVMLRQVIELIGDLYDALEGVLDEQGVAR